MAAQWKDGDIWKNPDLARTLRRLVEAEKAAAPQGRAAALKAARDRFYKGDIAREMAHFSEENGGLFRYEDFANYTAKLEEPVSIDYRGYTIYKNASATQGPAELVALNILEGYDLKQMGLNSADYIHTSAEAIKLAMADRDTYLGDMDFIQIPYRGLLSKEYAAARRKLIDPEKASLEFRPGDVAPFAGPGYRPVARPRDVDIAGHADHEGDTSYIAVVDRDRNMISFTPSLHSVFGTKVVVGSLGFIINCRGDYFSLVPGHANALEPGKRPRSTLQGTLVMKDGQPYLVTGSPGADDQMHAHHADPAERGGIRDEYPAGHRGARAGPRAVSRLRRSRTPCIRAIWGSRAAFPKRCAPIWSGGATKWRCAAPGR